MAAMQATLGAALRAPLRAPAARRARSLTVRAMSGKREVIATDKAPSALGPYSQAIKVRNATSSGLGLISDIL